MDITQVKPSRPELAPASPSRAGTFALSAIVMLLGSAAGCASGPTADELERSRREFKLAATLRDEGSVPAAIEHLRQALELDPHNARAHLLMGYIQMERRDFSSAEQSLRRGIELEGEGERPGSALAEARNVLGLVLIHLGRHEEAVTVLRESAGDPLNTAPHLAWGNLGLAYYEKGEYPRALEALTQAVQIQPRFCVGYFLMGQTHFEREEFDEAEEALNKAIEADEFCTDHYQEAWKLRGETRARLGHREEAIADFERCVELNPNTEAGQTCRRLLANTGAAEPAATE